MEREGAAARARVGMGQSRGKGRVGYSRVG